MILFDYDDKIGISYSIFYPIDVIVCDGSDGITNKSKEDSESFAYISIYVELAAPKNMCNARTFSVGGWPLLYAIEFEKGGILSFDGQKY